MEHYFSKKPKSREKIRVIKSCIRGILLSFYTSSSVFSPREIDEGTKLLGESMIIPENSIILDLGCGYGVLGILAAKLCNSCRVYMIDINERAVELSKKNAKLNGVEDKVIVLQGDGFEPVKNLKFDVIITNPPYTAGENIVKEWIKTSIEYLKEKGVFQMVVPKKFSGKYEKVLKKIYRKVIKVGENKKYICYAGIK